MRDLQRVGLGAIVAGGSKEDGLSCKVGGQGVEWEEAGLQHVLDLRK